MAKKNGWNADEMQGSLISDMEQEVKNGYQKIGESRGDTSALGGDGHTGDSPSVIQPTVSAPSQQGQSPSVPTAPQTAASALRNDEPTKGVQANLPISLYNRMKRLKFETDESFQSMFQRAMDLFLDVEEGKMKVSKVSAQ